MTAPARLAPRRGLARRAGSLLVGRLLPRGVAFPIARGPLQGMRFVLGSAAGDGGGASIYFNLSEPEQTRRVQEHIAPGQTFFDVGANVGYYTLLAARGVGPAGRVVAFEPFVQNLAHLTRHVTLNRLSNVIVMPYALSNVQGMLEFKLGLNGALGCLAGVGGERDADDRDARAGSVSVPATTLDAFVAQHGLAPDVLKIDVEGAEMLVLDGGRRTIRERRPVIALSTHTDALRSECLAFLAGEGYGVSALDGVSLDAAHDFLATPELHR